MAGPSKVNIDVELSEVERIINYRFRSRNLLSCSLGDLSTTHTIATNYQRSEFLVRMGRLVLDATAWGLFWNNALATEFLAVSHYHRDTLAKFVFMRGALDDDAHLMQVAHKCGLLPYLERRGGRIGPRLQAIIGAVLIDAEGSLQQAENVLRVLGIINSDQSFSVPGSAGPV